MRKNSSDDEWPEIVFSSSTSRASQAIRRAIKQGRLYKIAPKLYTSNFQDTPAEIIKKHRYQILSQLFPQAVISHRSALEGGISPEGRVILSYKHTRNVSLPGFEIRLIKGPPADADDTPFLENLYIASRGRALLENMKPSRARGKGAKTLSLKEIEERLDRMARVYGIEELNLLRDQAREVSKRLDMQPEFFLLDKMIGALMGTRPETILKTEAGVSRSRGEPFDPFRVELFAILSAYLQQQDFPARPRTTVSAKSHMHEAFFEAYFSNYIEGTEFAIEEAEKIIFENKIFLKRPEDSHDILSTYQLISEKIAVPQTCEQFLSFLLHRHAQLMESRKDKTPGQFKDIINRAGSTLFVKPEEVRGTLAKAFAFYQNLKPGMARVQFIMFAVAEVHPFIDGNGRIARIMMNGECDAANHCRIIIPTVFREDYLLALRRLSRQLDPAPYVKMLQHAQQFTASIPFEEYHEALAKLKAANAFLEPNEGKLII